MTEVLPSASDIRTDCDTVRSSMALQRYRTCNVLTHYYGVSGLSGYASADFNIASASTRYRALASWSHQNAMRAVIDTRLSQTVRVPDLRVQTLGGNYSRQRSARKIGQWLSGSFRRNDFGRLMWQVCTDAATNPLGAARVWYEADGMHLMRVRPDQVIYNPREGKKPCNLWLRYGVHRKKLVARAKALPSGKDKDRIVKYLEDKNAPPAYEEDPIYRSLDLVAAVDADMLEVIEHWRLSEDSEEDGVYTITCGEEVLNPGAGRAWKHDFFPVVELVDFLSFDSFGGQSIGEQLLPYQLTLNRMSKTIDTGVDRLAKGRVYLPIGQTQNTNAGSPTERQQFSRTVGEFVEYNPAWGKPVIQAGQAFSPEYYQRFDKVELSMWELAGVDRASGTGTEPAGLADASGKARRERKEDVNARQKHFSDNIDNWVERLCTVALGLGVEHFAGKGDAADTKRRRNRKVIAAAGTELLEEVSWKQLDVKETEGVLVRCVGVSGLPAHPSARLEYAKEGYEAGFWNKTYAVKLLAQPDIERAEDSATAAFDLATFHIEGALFDGKNFTPEPNRDYLEVLIDIGARELMRALRLGVEEAHAEILRKQLEVANKMLAGMPPAAPVPGAPGATPPGATPAMTAQAVPQDASLGALQ